MAEPIVTILKMEGEAARTIVTATMRSIIESIQETLEESPELTVPDVIQGLQLVLTTVMKSDASHAQ